MVREVDEKYLFAISHNISSLQRKSASHPWLEKYLALTCLKSSPYHLHASNTFKIVGSWGWIQGKKIMGRRTKEEQKYSTSSRVTCVQV